MVDVSSQNNSVSINISSSGNSASIKATPDTAMYYSEKAREWAISNRIVDNEDYSSKYYANKAKESASSSESYVEDVRIIFNSFTEVSEQAISELNEAKDVAIADFNVVANEALAEYTEISNQIKQENSEASKLAKDWATSAVLVDNIDYSAKYYAEKAKDNSGIFYDEIQDEDIDVEIISGGYVTKSDLELGLDTKQDKGDYATRTELTEGLDTKQAKGNYALKSDLNNLATKSELPTQVSELINDSNYATQTQVLQAIASIPQFSLSIVNALPTTGEKMTLYLVPKEGTNNDVYDEYIWIEQTSSFEHLGTTAVDLTDYVKNTDYATSDKGGVVKTHVSVGTMMTVDGFLQVVRASDADITNKTNASKPIVPKNLDYAVKTGVTTNTLELTDAEKLSARTWLGAVGFTDYASGSKAGVIRVDNGNFGTAIDSGYLTSPAKTLEQYGNARANAFIGKGTLDNVLTQYAKTQLITEADYNALATKDSNTLYLIEE